MSLPASDLNKKPDYRTTMELGAVLPKTAEVKNDHLFIGGVDMVELAQQEGTALYVFDEADLRDRMQQYERAFRSRYENSDIVFASKAFCNKEVLRIVNQEGLCLDVSGGGELACAQAVGFPMENVVMHGNNKTPRELEEAISAGVGRIVLDSRIELSRVNEIAARLGKVQDVLMRITPGVEADTHEYIRTGCEDSKFGFTMKNDFAFNCVGDVLAAENVRLLGFHCHIGSQIFALTSFREAVQVMTEFVLRVKEKYGFVTKELDMGGGLGIAYTADDRPSSIDEFAECTVSAVRDFCAHYQLEEPRIMVEPGRSLVANAGVTLYTVGILKTLPGIRKYVAVDGGMSVGYLLMMLLAAYFLTGLTLFGYQQIAMLELPFGTQLKNAALLIFAGKLRAFFAIAVWVGMLLVPVIYYGLAAYILLAGWVAIGVMTANVIFAPVFSRLFLTGEPE